MLPCGTLNLFLTVRQTFLFVQHDAKILLQWNHAAVLRFHRDAGDAADNFTARNGVTRVEIPNGIEPFVCPISPRAVLGKSDPGRCQYGVLGNALGRVQIFLNQRRRHRLCGTGVDETFSCSTIHWKLVSRIERSDTGQVTDGIVVLCIIKPPQNDWTRVASLCLSLSRKKRPYPRLQAFPFGVVRL